MSASAGSGTAARRLLDGPPVRAVLFDYGLTLVHFTRPERELRRAQRDIAAALAAGGHPAPGWQVLQEAVHDRVDAAVAAHDAGGSLEEVDTTVLERQAFHDIGIDLGDDLLDHCSRLLQEAWWHGVHLFPEVTDTLRELRAMGLRVGVCSNAPYRPASMHGQLRHLGLDALLDSAVFSGEVGWRKPSPTLFRAALVAIDASASSTVFVGDRLREDIDGATAAGLRALLLARGSGAAPLRGRSAPTVIRSLAELPALFREER